MWPPLKGLPIRKQSQKPSSGNGHNSHAYAPLRTCAGAELKFPKASAIAARVAGSKPLRVGLDRSQPFMKNKVWPRSRLGWLTTLRLHQPGPSLELVMLVVYGERDSSKSKLWPVLQSLPQKCKGSQTKQEYRNGKRSYDRHNYPSTSTEMGWPHSQSTKPDHYT